MIEEGFSEGSLDKRCEVVNLVSIDCVYSFIIASFFFHFKGEHKSCFCRFAYL